MAMYQKDVKKVATKAPKQAGAHKLPKYAQSESASTMASSMEKTAAKSKK